ncbi:gastrula zinc finger protein XlCGF17.1-like [Pelobates fuscus]|uniref:gastrula zinc finger protein XlCGF17.1-like n=1 Tax=Pelobates fuscus TaxID=191477 RepID=UPI002FE4718D
MEEWEYLEGHKDLYRDVMISNYQTLCSLDKSLVINTAKVCNIPFSKQYYMKEERMDYETNPAVRLNEPRREERNVNGESGLCEEWQKSKNPSTNIKEESVLHKGVILTDTDNNTPKNNTPVEQTSVSIKKEESNIPDTDIYISNNTGISTEPENNGNTSIINRSERVTVDNSATSVSQQSTHCTHKMYTCSDCHKCFTGDSDLIKHQGIPIVKQFKCSECGKYFASKYNLVVHSRTHTGVKPFPCSECGKCYSFKSHLLTHQRSHTGEKPFPCSVCGKTFSRNSHRIAHQNAHTGVKSFSCSECEKCFKYKSHLISHQKIHTGEKPYLCSDCGKCFNRRSNLVEHQRSHTREKPFSCSICGKCFKSNSYRIRHQNAHTKKSLVF